LSEFLILFQGSAAFSNFSRLTPIVKELSPNDLCSETQAMSKARDHRPFCRLPDPLPSKAFAGFSQPPDRRKIFNPGIARIPHRENQRPTCPVDEIASSSCTKSGHPPVDHLHSIENKIDKIAQFSLTQKLEGVQENRSLTVS
jgi:hypothetical protein